MMNTAAAPPAGDPDDPMTLPLRGVRVIDLTDGKGEMCGRYLADLGADVVLVEPRTGAAARRRFPVVDGTSLYFAGHHANKRGIALDFDDPADLAVMRRLVADADIVIESTAPGTLDRHGLDGAALLAAHPGLVICSITDFGQTGPARDQVATGAVLMALGGVLCRSGLPGQPPLLPPVELALECAAVQAAWCVLVAYWNRLRTGAGDHLDFSCLEAVAQLIDPGLGITGSARAGASAMLLTRDRPDAAALYPIVAGLDGFVRICVLSLRQWRSMRDWLGNPEPLLADRYDSTAYRMDHPDEVDPYVARLFAGFTCDELVAEGQRRGVPIGRVREPAEPFDDDHFAARGSFADVPLGTGRSVRMPFGYAEVNGRRAGLRRPAPALDADRATVLAGRSGASHPPGAGTVPAHPLRGLRVLDLGVIVVGAELGRLFADQGAEVIKIENLTYPDGSRQSADGRPMTPSFASGHRGKLSLGLDLRTAEGLEIFRTLVARSDVILSNFKPGTMESLGIGYEQMCRVNPLIVMADSSALGSTGPKSRSMGYGPLVRAETGLTRLWSYPDLPAGFCDGITIFPDHFAARVEAVAVLAALLDRERTGRGGTVSVAQAETILSALADRFAWERLRGNESGLVVGGDETIDGVLPAAGDDEWCVVSVRHDADWSALCTVLERPDLAGDPRLGNSAGRSAHRAELFEQVAEWTATLPPRTAAARLQAVGVPAGAMVRLEEYADDPQLTARGFIRQMAQPGLDYLVPVENGPCRSRHLADPGLAPAPFVGEHTREIARRLLGLQDAQVQRLIAAGVLQEGAGLPRAGDALVPG